MAARLAPRRSLAWLALASLAACADAGAEPPGMTLAAALAAAQASLGAAAPEFTAPVAANPALQPAAWPGVTARGPAPRSTAEFAGASPDVLRRWLGEPLLRRAEGSAEVWLYSGSACALDLVLYRDAAGLRVAMAAARAAGTAQLTEAACLATLGGPARPRLQPAAAEGGEPGA